MVTASILSMRAPTLQRRSRVSCHEKITVVTWQLSPHWSTHFSGRRHEILASSTRRIFPSPAYFTRACAVRSLGKIRLACEARVTNAHPCLHYLCTAGLYAAHDLYHIRTLSLPCVKLSPTCHAAPGRCGEARDEATHLHDLVSSSLVYTVFVSKAPIRAFCVHIADCVLSYRRIYYVVSFFLLLVALHQQHQNL